jgi:translocation and assembly module TamA
MPDGSIPVVVEFTERKPRVIGAGVFFSTTEGGAVNGYWAHRNLFGGAETVRVEAEVARLFLRPIRDVDLKLAAHFTKPAIITGRDDLITSATFVRESPDAYRRLALNLDGRIRRQVNRQLAVEGGLEVEASRVTDVSGTRSHLLVGVPLEARYDTTDDRLAPTRGFRASIGVEPMVDLRGGAFFNTFDGEVSAYRSLGEDGRFIAAGRLRAGAIVGAPLLDIPADRRFYAGGGGSVRGFGFQALSPRDAAGNIVGGRSLIEASLELRIALGERIGVVPFIDVGRAYSTTLPNPFREGLGVGAGVGLRYRTPIGAVRLDVAFPLNEPRGRGFGVYIGLGESF